MNNPDTEVPQRKSLPDCVNCDASGCTGSCSRTSCGTDDGAPSGCDDCNANPQATPADFKFDMNREPRGKIFATDWLGDISTSADFPIVQVQFKNTRNGFYANPQKFNLNIGDMVAVEAAPGHDIGRVSMVGPLVSMQMKKNRLDPETAELKKIFRIATPTDLERFEEARKREHDTMIRSRGIAEELGLDMKIGDVEYQGDGSKAIFYYIADERVDFRKLIRLLADEFHVRIEMKQIGARQEAGRIGGIGPCGRPLCCSSWMTHFVSVGTGAARMQDLSMNPQKLAGQCAKLKCCLNFEIDTYAESSRKLPSREQVLETQDGEYFFFKADILQRLVTYSTDRKIPANLVTIPAARAFEIIALNKQGVKPEKLEEAKEDTSKPAREYIDLTDQDSLTRFDRSRKKNRGNGKPNRRDQNSGGQERADSKKGDPNKNATNRNEPNKSDSKGNTRPNNKETPKNNKVAKPPKNQGQQKDRRPKERRNQSKGNQQRKPDGNPGTPKAQ